MASRGTEREMLEGGMDLNSRGRGSWKQNMRYRQGAWETRPGFGQVCQFDTTLGLQSVDLTSQFGYERIAGAEAMVTSQGHLHVLVLCELLAFTGQIEASPLGMWTKLWSLSIYDKTTGQRWEETLHRPTAGLNVEIAHPPLHQGVFQTSNELDTEDALWGGSEAEVFWHEYADTMFFGSKDIGLFAYRPADFIRTRRMQTETAFSNANIKGYGESAIVFKIVAADGDFSDSQFYLDSGSYPNPVDVTNWGDRLVLARGREIFVCDSGRPTSIQGTHIFPVPADLELVGIAAAGEVLYAFTDREVFLVQLSGDVNARVTRVSSDVGAVGAGAITSGDRHLYWTDRHGVYAGEGTLSFKKISDPIDPFFRTSVSNPLTQYWVNSGFSDLANDQPRVELDFNDVTGAHMSYDPVEKHLFLTVPSQNISWVWFQGVWSLWNYESVYDSNVVDATRGMPNPRLLTAAREVLMVAGPEVYTPDDNITLGGDGETDEDHNAKMASWYLLELGRGGGLDRSVEVFEDNRKLSGYYRLGDVGIWGTEGGDIYLGEPIALEDDYVFPVRGAMSDCYLFPVCARFRSLSPTVKLTSLVVSFEFDNVQWEPVTISAASPQLDLIMPPERYYLREGWGLTTPAVGKEARVYQAAAPDASGNRIDCRWSGVAGAPLPIAASSNSLPNMNLDPTGVNTIFYIGFRRLNSTPNAMSLGVDWTSNGEAGYDADGPIERFFNPYHWMFPAPDGLHAIDDVAQPVDWVVQPKQFMRKDGVQMLFRTLYARMTSEGAAEATSRIADGTTFGLYNVLVGSDARTWSAQIVDADGPGLQTMVDKSTVRSRLLDAASAFKDVIFNHSSLWGDDGDSTKGNTLIGDTSEETIAVSDAVRGESLTVMMFGHIRSRGERLALSSARMMYRLRGGRRRRGR